MFVVLLEDLVLVGNDADWFHHCADDKIKRISQNDISAIIQFIGDRWGIIKSP